MAFLQHQFEYKNLCFMAIFDCMYYWEWLVGIVFTVSLGGVQLFLYAIT